MTRRLLTRALALQAREARPLLGGFALFFLLFCANTFLYIEQARLVEAAFPDEAVQTRVFGLIDANVQALAMLAGAAVCVAWAANGHLLAKAQARREADGTPAA